MQPTPIQPSLLNKFTEHLQKQDRAPKTIQGYICDLESFARWFHQSNGEKLTNKNLTSTDVRDYRDWLAGRDAAPSTVNRHLATLRAVNDN
jgi:site-specific recombinase XerD